MALKPLNEQLTIIGCTQMIKRNQTGFTIVELAIATMVFASVLLLVTFGLLQIGKSFAKSVNEARSREAANTIVEDVSNAVRFSGGEVFALMDSPSENNKGFCVGSRRYSYAVQKRIENDGEHAFVVDTLNSGCNSSTRAQDFSALAPGSSEVLGKNMFIDSFSFNPVGTGGFHEISIRVVYGQESFLDASRQCNADDSTYCAVTELKTVVQKRIK